MLKIACEKIAGLDVPAFIKDSELRFVAVNDGFAAFFGVTPEEVIGQRAGALTDRPEDLAWEDVERRALVFAEEHLALCFDRSGRRHCRVQIERFVTEDEMPYIFGVFRERPGRIKSRGWRRDAEASAPQTASAAASVAGSSAAGAALFAPGADHAMLLDLLPLGVLLLDADEHIVYFNRNFTEILDGLSLEISVGMPFRALLGSYLDGQIGKAPEENDAGEAPDFLCSLIDEGCPRQFNLASGRVISVTARRLDNGQSLLLYSDITEAQTYERESSLYRAALENVPEPVFLRDSERRLVFANAAYEQMLGGDRTRFYGLREDEMFPAEAEMLRAENLEVLETGCTTEREQLIVMPNGSTVPLLTSLKRIEATDGAHYIVGTLADVSLLKIGEANMREAKAQAEKLYDDIEAILRTMPVGVMIVGADQVLTFSNPMARNMANWPEEKPLTGTPFADYLRHAHAEGWPLTASEEEAGLESRIAAYSQQLRDLNNVSRIEVVLADGRHIAITASPLDDGQTMLTFSDDTEQRLREREIDEARARLQDVGKLLEEATQVMAQGLCVIQRDRILYRNDKLAEILDLSPQLVVGGADWRELADYCAKRGDFGDDSERFFERMKSGVRQNGSATAVVQRRDGAWRSIDIIASAEDRWLFVIGDVSEAKRREAELTTLAVQAEAADKAKSRFLASMSHEIRTPMNGVLGMAELLLASQLDARQKTFVDVIVKSGRSLLTVINDILDFSKIDDGSLTLRSAPFDPLAAVEDVVTLMAGRATEKDLELLVSGQGQLTHMLSGDAGRLRQILTNLLGEAIRATDRGHVLIDIGMRHESRPIPSESEMPRPASDDETSNAKAGADRVWLVLRIEDTGSGITAEQRDLAFSRFPTHVGVSHYRYGSGVGLSIAYGLVDLFGGTLEVDNKPGHGVAVTITLPFTLGAEKVPSLAGFHLRGARVLAFESSPIGCGILNDQLFRWGFDGVAVDDPALALAVLEQAESQGSPIELLLVDGCRRSDGGLDLVRKLRNDSRFERLAIILLATEAPLNPSGTAEGIDVQVQLAKPVGENLLRNAVIDVLRTARREAGSSETLAQPGSGRDDLGDLLHQVAAGPSPSWPHSPAPPASLVHDLPPRPASFAGDRTDLLILASGGAVRDFFQRALQSIEIGHAYLSEEHEALALWRLQRPAIMLIDLVTDRERALDVVRQMRAEEELDRATGRQERHGQDTPTVLIGLATDLSTYDKAACHKAGLDDLVLETVSPDRLRDCIGYWLGAGISAVVELDVDPNGDEDVFEAENFWQTAL
ncbi:PAS-domain containing protein [Allorhizobium taibaishanense]|uniref:histidine kinase n=1 Tax=Allorhizobium taibaishanense TaxID=887144 RepID=A0A1Q9A492_9HYPH|nr:PAS-domain containing protein [Allorhizobium taibaishanense]MBB4006460.1 PAS domain S-box-containing protein [Allorhizobium taibaishanense]OLP49401.1 hypothetical protein BJF91_20370 [Allorhizobium taibaishanense]